MLLSGNKDKSARTKCHSPNAFVHDEVLVAEVSAQLVADLEPTVQHEAHVSSREELAMLVLSAVNTFKFLRQRRFVSEVSEIVVVKSVESVPAKISKDRIWSLHSWS